MSIAGINPTTLEHLTPQLLTEIGTYLPESRDRANAIVASKLFRAPFKESASQLLREFCPILPIDIEQDEKNPEKTWQKVTVQVDQILNENKFFLSEEEKKSLEKKNLSFIQRKRILENALENYTALPCRFFEKIANFVPEAKSFSQTLPLKLSRVEMAQKIYEWMGKNHDLLNRELQQDLSAEEQEIFQEDRITKKLDALLWGLEEFPRALFFIDLPEQAQDALYYILRGLPYPAFYQGVRPPPPVSLYYILGNIAKQGYLGLVKAFLATPTCQRQAETGMERTFRVPLLGALKENRLGVIRAIVTAPCFKKARFYGSCSLQVLDRAIDNNMVEATRLLLETLDESVIGPRFSDFLARAKSRGQQEIVSLLWDCSHREGERRRRRIDEGRYEKAMKVARRLF